MSVAEVRTLRVVLPIGISFFTFTQIAYLVDCYEGKVRERNFLHYALFVSYFPHLIAPAFSKGLTEAFSFAAGACLVGAVASLLRGGKYHYVETEKDSTDERIAEVVPAQEAVAETDAESLLLD